MPTKTQAVKLFLEHATLTDLAGLYNPEMECQVNVAQDGGERVSNEFKGRRWHGWSDGLTTWKSFRIPYKAATEPEYTDSEIKWDITVHAEAIGMTGWNWTKRVSQWVAFDFDAMVGHSDQHSKKLSNLDLQRVQDAACDIDWVTVRRSTSGRGLHLYVMLNDFPTANHSEHAALGRAILSQMSALAGFDFDSKVDICGGNMWVWHRKMKGTNGLEIIKSGTTLMELPKNWKDHLEVVKNTRRKNLPQDISPLDTLTGKHTRVQLDECHRSLINYLKENDMLWWWDKDKHMLVTHTLNLKDASVELNFIGYYDTASSGQNRDEQNCFLFPMRRGSWSVRRFSPGCTEHESWLQDSNGWTYCYLNRDPDLSAASRAMGAIEDPSGGFVFKDAHSANEAAKLLGTNPNVSPALIGRTTTLKEGKDGRLIMEIAKEDKDDAGQMPGWLPKKGKWVKIFNVNVGAPQEAEICDYDDTIRHIVTDEHENYGWVVMRDNIWGGEPINHVRVAMRSMGMNPKDIDQVLGASIFKPWMLVNKPFQPEYPGDRQWNRDAAQLRYVPSDKEQDELVYPHWKNILEHCGCGLNDSIINHPWARANGIKNGADYLKCWTASLFQSPLEPLPYLFFHGLENTGKSIFHEALSLLLTKGYKRAENALTNQNGFNAEIEGAIICVTEEIDLQSSKVAYNRMKDWVTARELLIHRKGETPYHSPNSTHWIQCANNHRFCPVFSGDTRITMIYVEPLDPLDLIPKRDLIIRLEQEAPDFLAEILQLEIPPSNDRLNVPVITTSDKNVVQNMNLSAIDEFIRECYEPCNGNMIKYGDMYDDFVRWMNPDEVHSWSKKRFTKELPPQYPKGRARGNGQFHIGNIKTRSDGTLPARKIILSGEYLETSRD